jgi:hypothetical protein
MRNDPDKNRREELARELAKIVRVPFPPSFFTWPYTTHLTQPMAAAPPAPPPPGPPAPKPAAAKS